MLQTEQQADPTRGRLGPELAAGRGLLVDQREDHPEEVGPGVALREPERHGALRPPIDLGHPVHLGAGAFVVGARALEARRDFVHALAVTAEHVGDREKLAFVGPGAGNEPAVGHPVQERAGRGEPERARADRFVDERGHLRDLVVGGRRFVEAAFAHRVVPRIAQCPIIPPTLRPLGMRSMAERYSP